MTGKQDPGSIRDIPSHRKLADRASDFAQLQAAWPLLRAIASSRGVTAEGLADVERQLERIPELQAQTEGVIGAADRFNVALRDRGWIASGEMGHDAMVRATNAAEAGELDEAEAIVVGCWSADVVKLQVERLWAIEVARPRLDILRLAVVDYAEERYHACVPVVLAQLEGIITDSGAPDVFSRKTSQAGLVAPDSIAAHPTGLPVLISILGKGRRKGSLDEPMTVPNRHAITHGRNVTYGSRLVAAKAWAALFAVRDFALAVQNARYDQDDPSTTP